jgi:hypothetical protein
VRARKHVSLDVGSACAAAQHAPILALDEVIVSRGGDEAEGDVVRTTSHAGDIAGAAACALMQGGWALELRPGAPVVLRKAGVDLRPFEVMQAIARSEASPEAWRQVHEVGRISDRRLVDAP